MVSPSSTYATTDLLNLEIARAADRIKICLATQRAGETQTVRHVEELSVSMDRINARCQKIFATLNQANRQGRLSTELLNKLKEVGQLFRDDLFSTHIKTQFNDSAADQLIVTLDDHLVHIPWELLHDGEQFLSQRFAMGRVVRTRQQVISRGSRRVMPPLQMLVLADPCGDLKAAYAEGIDLRDGMEAFQDKLWVSFRSEGVSSDFIKAKMRNFDWVHFAGHADYDDQHPNQSGWRLSRGQLTAADVLNMAGTGAMPALVFSNACQSARTHAWEDSQDRIFGLANAFILAGVKHYVGTFWEIPDETSRHFALSFYRFLLKGLSVGSAVRAARKALIEVYGEAHIVWASYLLYGDPTVTYLEQTFTTESSEPSESERVDAPLPDIGAELRGPEEVIRFASNKVPPWFQKRHLVRFGAAALVVLAIGWTLVAFGIRKSTGQYEARALTAFQTGNYTEVEQTCRRLQAQAPQRSLGYLLQGNVSFLQGELENARFLFDNVLQAERGHSQDKAEALIGLGRIASESGQIEQALRYYRQAADMAPGNEQPYLAQAVLLEQQGDYAQAAELLNTIKPEATDPATLASLAARIRRQAAAAEDQQRQARIDQLIEELQEERHTAQESYSEQDWRSRPLTVWLMDMEMVGYSLREGSAALLTGRISDRLLAQKRVQLVERDLLDKLMVELKLGASNLTDLPAALSLGRLMAARLVISGRMVHRAPNTEVTLRCIETETSQIAFVVNALFDTQTPVSAMATRISDELILKIQKQYPLRAKVVEKQGNKLVLDIGRRHGAFTGATLNAADNDLSVQVIDVDTDQCSAQILVGEELVQIGLRLEEMH